MSSELSKIESQAVHELALVVPDPRIQLLMGACGGTAVSGGIIGVSQAMIVMLTLGVPEVWTRLRVDVARKPTFDTGGLPNG